MTSSQVIRHISHRPEGGVSPDAVALDKHLQVFAILGGELRQCECSAVRWLSGSGGHGSNRPFGSRVVFDANRFVQVWPRPPDVQVTL